MKSIDALTEFVARVAAFTLGLLTLLIIYDALGRYLFHTGSIALQELEWHLFDVIILLGISYALKSGAHVRVDIFYAHFSLKTQTWVNIISLVCFILPFSLLVIYMGFDFVLQSYEQHEASPNPGGLSYRYLIKSVMLLSFMLLITQALSELVKSVKVLRS